MESRASVVEQSAPRRLPDDFSDAPPDVLGGVEDGSIESSPDDVDVEWPGPIDEPPPLFS